MEFYDLDENGRRIAQEGDYRNELGRLYCGRCHAPKELLATDEEGNVVKTWPRECDCEMVRRQVSEAKTRLAQKRSVLPFRYSRRFSDSDGRAGEAERIARKYVERFDSAKSLDVNGLLFHGDVGLGKTFLASCIGTELAAAGKRVTVRSMAELVAEAMEHGFDRDSWTKELLRCDLLVLDDLGVERSTDTAFEIVFHVVDSAVRDKKPMVVTTNLSMATLSNPERVENARIYSRVLGACLPVKVEGTKGRVSPEKLKEAMEFYV